MENLVAFFAKFTLKREDKAKEGAIDVEASEKGLKGLPALESGS